VYTTTGTYLITACTTHYLGIVLVRKATVYVLKRQAELNVASLLPLLSRADFRDDRRMCRAVRSICRPFLSFNLGSGIFDGGQNRRRVRRVHVSGLDEALAATDDTSR